MQEEWGKAVLDEDTAWEERGGAVEGFAGGWESPLRLNGAPGEGCLGLWDGQQREKGVHSKKEELPPFFIVFIL